MRDNSRLISFMLVVAAFAISAVAYPHLPAAVPTHWGLTGTLDGFGDRVQGALMLPIIMLAVWLLLVFALRYDRLLFIKYDTLESDSTTVRPVYNVMVGVVLAMLLAIHTFAITSALGLIAHSRQPVVIACIASLGAILIGNYMPRVTRRNAFIGFRVPWAYASEDVWRRTQRAGGYGLVAGGVIGLVGAVAIPGAPLKPFFVAMIAQIVIVALYSYRLAHSSSAS